MIVDKFNNEIGYMTIDIDGMLSDYGNEMNGFKYLFRVSEATDEDYKKVCKGQKLAWYDYSVKYMGLNMRVFTLEESFQSLMVENGIDLDELSSQGKDIVVLKRK